MDLSSLVKILRHQADTSQSIIFNDDFLSSLQIGSLQKTLGLKAEYLTIKEIISKDIPDPIDQQLKINAGTVNIFLQENLNLQVIFSLDDKQNLQFIISVKLPESWQFKDSFENLTVFPFNKITTSSGYVIYSTLEEEKYTENERTFYPWADKLEESVILTQGLNIASWLRLDIFNGATVLLEEVLTGSDECKFYGPITVNESIPYPVLNLAFLLLEKKIEITDKISVGNLELVINVSEPKERLQDLSLRLSASTQDLNFGIEILNNSEYLSFFAEPVEEHIFGINQILELPGGSGFQDNIPKELSRFFDEVALQSFLITKGVGSNIGMIELIIGSNPKSSPWEIIHGVITLCNLRLNVTQFMPGTESSLTICSFRAEAQILEKVFLGEFYFYIELDKNTNNGVQISNITASYYGSVKLSDLVQEIVGNTTHLPDVLNNISFSDFGLDVTKEVTGYSFAIYGQAETSLPIMDTSLIAALNVAATYSKDAYRVELGGCFLVGSQNFELKLDLGKSNEPANLTNSTIIMSAEWQVLDENYLQLEDIAKAFGFSEIEDIKIPEELDLSLKEANFYYDFSKEQLLICCESKNYGSAVFSAVKGPITKPKEKEENEEVDEEKEGWHFFFGVAVDKAINLTSLPLIKNVVSDEDLVGIKNIQVVVVSSSFDSTAAETINELIEKIEDNNSKKGNSNKRYPRVPVDSMPEGGICLSMDFCAGFFETPLNLSISKHSKSDISPSVTGPSMISLPIVSESVLTPSITSPLPEYAAGAALLSARTIADTIPSTAASDGTMWYNIQKTFGPVSFQKVGIRYKESILYVLMNASVGAGVLTISVLGLGVGSCLTRFEPHFNIDGLAITFKEGTLEISGGLVGTIDPINFYGELIISTPNLTISALGAYAELENHPSFFMYAVLNYPIGGPVYFFVTGLAAGFGFNRKLLIPDISDVEAFPLVRWAVGDPPSAAGTSITDKVSGVLSELSECITPLVGEYWLAVGIRFTTCKLLDCFALLTASFGTSFEIDLLGIARLVLPPAVQQSTVPVPPVAVVELALKASFSPEKGLVAVEGQLTSNSFILSKDCHLTGGFAFYLWFIGENAGDFVLTIGGYSPRFELPAHYPQVPRLGLNWNLSPPAQKPSSSRVDLQNINYELTIKGNLYFALTPSAVMAGGELSAVWKCGDINAWFDFNVDFLMTFAPLHYYLSAQINMGVSFVIDLLFTKKTITSNLGIGLEIWGPEFTGRATVDLRIISFTINFGASGQSTKTTISWSDFIKQLMPESSGQKPVKARRIRSALCKRARDEESQPSIVQIRISDGLIKTVYEQDGKEVKFYVVNAERFELITQTAIPAKESKFSSNLTPKQQLNLEPNTNFGIGPTGTDNSNFTSSHSIEIDSEEKFIAIPILSNVPKALWEKREFDSHGVPKSVDPVNNTTISNVLVGYKVIADKTEPDHTLPIPIENLLYTIDPNIQNFQWSTPSYPKEDSFKDEKICSTISTPNVEKNRQTILSAIHTTFHKTFEDPIKIDVSDLADLSKNYLLADPLLRLLGEQKVQEVLI